MKVWENKDFQTSYQCDKNDLEGKIYLAVKYRWTWKKPTVKKTAKPKVEGRPCEEKQGIDKGQKASGSSPIHLGGKANTYSKNISKALHS